MILTLVKEKVSGMFNKIPMLCENDEGLGMVVSSVGLAVRKISYVRSSRHGMHSPAKRLYTFVVYNMRMNLLQPSGRLLG